AMPAQKAEARAQEDGLDTYAAANLVTYLHEQAEATNILPSDTNIVVERFRDELGDWRLVVHSPYGRPVHAPWALAINARIRERYGVDGQAIDSDDGIVIRLPDTDAEAPTGEIIVFEPDEIEDLVTTEVGGSALFASRFRECAARALLLPRRDPGRRSPLWQQRQRSAALLEVASQYPSFPIILEAVRECLRDVYDLPSLVGLLQRIERREISIVDVATPTPSPYAQSLLFGYVAQFLYEGDSPLAERRAAALTLDQGLLAELLGRAELRELLDPEVLAEVESELQRLAPGRRARGAEGITDLVRTIGPLTLDEIVARTTPAEWSATSAEASASSGDTSSTDISADGSDASAVQADASADRGDVSAMLEDLATARRVVEVRVAGEARWAVVEDVARLRDGLGVAVPPGVPSAFTEPVEDPVGDLVSRYARSHGPFTAADVAARLGLGEAVVRHALARLSARGRVLDGEFRPGGSGLEWCDADVLRMLRRRSLARLRKEVEPVEPAALGRFLPAWQKTSVRKGALRGVDGVLSVVDQLAGCPVPASALESLILPARVVDYEPAFLDELTAGGEVLWAGHGTLPGTDGWVSLHPADTAELTLPPPTEMPPGPLAERLLEALEPGGAWFFHQLARTVTTDDEKTPSDADLSAALWELVWSGRVSNDTLLPLRALTRSGTPSHRSRRPPPRARGGRYTGGARMPTRASLPETAGRWTILPEPDPDPTKRAHAAAERLLDRHGVVTRGSVQSERTPGGFAAVYKVLSAFEESGRARRGYFVEGLGAAQFGTAGSVDRLRTFSRVDPSDKPVALALAATDPANPYGAALPWPVSEEGHRPGRKAGAIVVLVDGELALYVERGGRTLLTWSEDPNLLEPAAEALADAVRRGALGRLTVEKADGAPLLGSGETPLRQALQYAGFIATPRGLRLTSSSR
ncbi:DNA glycosylase AlkZ-like family protein, partial [Nocardioides sp. NPDC057772]|uniref:DNA glycosylase AlkZ-like family protein n=1 Tax=Nocardioides sp. NPDC057772 TaxID=3346245 RepID=UPI003671FD94